MNASPLDLVIHSGELVLPGDSYHADLGMRDGVIDCIGLNLQGKRSIDASGMLVLPGAVDPHVHLEMPIGKTVSSDDWMSGTRAAAAGGVTTLIDFVEPLPGEPLLHALETRKSQARGRAWTDHSLHMSLFAADDDTLAQIPGVVASGVPSFKTYTTYDGCLSDGELLRVLTAVHKAHGLVMVHAENDAIIHDLRSNLLAAGKTAPASHPLSRPPSSEEEAVRRVLALAEACSAPVYMVHLSTAGAVEALRKAQKSGQTAFGETCPQYLVLDDTRYLEGDFEGAKYVCSPPLRPLHHQTPLWNGLAGDVLQTIGTDHCPFFYKGQKELGRDDFTAIPGGLPGVELRLPLIYTYGVLQGRISLQRWVEVCCTNPARLFGLYPRKGSLLPGADADLVLFDPHKEYKVTHSILHENVDYTPYEGFPLTGCPVMTISRGQVIYADGKFAGSPQGEFIPAQSPFK